MNAPREDRAELEQQVDPTLEVAAKEATLDTLCPEDDEFDENQARGKSIQKQDAVRTGRRPPLAA